MKTVNSFNLCATAAMHALLNSLELV